MAMKIAVERGDIVYVDLSGNRGSEQGNSEGNEPRPCIVVQKNGGNASRPVTIVVPLTDASNNRGYAEQVAISAAELGSGFKDSVAECGHILTIDGDSRINNKRGGLTPETMRRIDAALKSSLALR